MKIMGHQFVMGRTIGEALARSRKGANAAYRSSFDMLGEAALTPGDADRYLHSYRSAIDAIAGSRRFEDEIVAPTSEERRVGTKCVSTCRSRWTPSAYTKKTPPNIIHPYTNKH